MTLLLWVAPAFVMAQEPLTLKKAMELGLDRNIGIKVAANQSDAVKNLANPGNANLLPKIDLNGSGTYSYATSTQTFANPAIPTIDTSGAATSVSAGLGFSYVLFDGLGNIRTYRKLRLNGEMSEMEERMIIENTVVGIATAYLAALRADQTAELARKNLSVSLKRLDRARKNAEYGTGTRTELLNAEIYTNADSATLIEALYMARKQKRDLLQLIQITEAEVGPIIDSIALAPMPNPQQTRDGALANNAALILAAMSVERAENDIKINRALAFPVLAINASYGYTRNTSETSFIRESENLGFNGGITLSYALFDGRKRRTQLQNAKLMLETDRLRQDQSKTEVLKNLDNGLDFCQTSLERVALRQRNLAPAMQNLKRVEELFNLGQLTGIEFREAQVALLRAEVDYLDARVQAKLAELDVLRLSGGLLSE